MTSFTTGIRLDMALNPKAFNAALESTRQRVVSFTSRVNGSAAKIQKGMQGAFQRFGQTAKKVFGDIRTWAALAATGVVTIFLKKLAMLGANAEDTEAKFQAVFKGVQTGADAAVESLRGLGLGLTEARGLLAGLQDTFVPLGFARDDALQLSDAFAKLGADLNSFNPTVQTTREATDLLTSAIVGNHEAVRRFGIIITEKSLDMKLLEMGFKKTSQGATEQQKILARSKIIFESSKDAMGDLIRTHDSFANTMRRLKSRLQEVLEEAGQEFDQWLLDTIDSMGGVEGVAQKLRDALSSLKPTLKNIGEDFRSAAKSISQADGEFHFALKAVQVLVVGFNGLRTGLMAIKAASPGQDMIPFLEAMTATQRSFDTLLDRQSDWVKTWDGMTKSVEKETSAQKENNKAIQDGGAVVDALAEKLKGSVAASAQDATKQIEKLKNTIADLTEQRADTAKDFEKRAFEVGFSGLKNEADQLQALHQRALEFRNKADTAKTRGDLEGARDALAEFAKIIERLNSVEGGAFAGLRENELKAVAEEVDTIFQNQIDAQQRLQQEMARVADEAKRFADNMAQAAANTQKAVDALAGTNTPPAQGMAAGGRVTDPRDTIPALLRPGETVLTPEHSRALAPFLRQIGVPGFASGGNVQLHDILSGTRRFASTGMALKQAEDSALRLYRAQQVKQLIESVGGNRASELLVQQMRAGIPIVPPDFQRNSSSFFPGAQGFADGGRAGASNQTFNFGGITLEYHSSGGTATDAVAMAGQIKRAVSRKMASLN